MVGLNEKLCPTSAENVENLHLASASSVSGATWPEVVSKIFCQIPLVKIQTAANKVMAGIPPKSLGIQPKSLGATLKSFGTMPESMGIPLKSFYISSSIAPTVNSQENYQYNEKNISLVTT